MIAGLAYLMVSLPTLFQILSSLDLGPTYVHRSLAFLWEQARLWATGAEAMSYSSVGIWLIRLSLFAIPALWVAALIRSAVVRSWRPFVVTFSASTLGAIGIPVAAWVGEILVVTWRLIDVIATFIATYILPWVLRILLWLGLAVLVVGTLYALFAFVRYLTQERKWLAFLAVAAVTGFVVGAGLLGWLDWLFDVLRWIGIWIERIVDWIVNLLAPILRWIGRALVVVLVFIFVLGLAVAFLGEVGRQLFLPVRSAAGAGGNQGRCADLAAGVGVAMSLALTAAVLDPSFSAWFADIWRSTPVVNLAPVPVDAYDALLPSAAEDLLRPAFVDYLPILDVGVLVFAAAMGVLSLLFSSAYWTPGQGSRVARPVLLGVGGAIACAVLILALVLVVEAVTGAISSIAANGG